MCNIFYYILFTYLITVGRRIIEKSEIVVVASSLEKLMIMKMVVENILMMKARRIEIGMMINWKNIAGFLFFLLPFSGVFRTVSDVIENGSCESELCFVCARFWYKE